MELDHLDAGLGRLQQQLAQLGREVSQARADYQRLLELNRNHLDNDPFSTGRSGLSQQERRVAILVASGLSNIEVAAQLHVTVHTVKSQVCSVLRKLDLHSRWQLRHVVREPPPTLTPPPTPSPHSPSGSKPLEYLFVTRHP